MYRLLGISTSHDFLGSQGIRVGSGFFMESRQPTNNRMAISFTRKKNVLFNIIRFVFRVVWNNIKQKNQ